MTCGILRKISYTVESLDEYGPILPTQEITFGNTTILKCTSSTSCSSTIFSRATTGILGTYSAKKGLGPYKRYFVGGDGNIGNYYNAVTMSKAIKLRGYPDPGTFGMKLIKHNGSYGGGLFTKGTMELRYPISLEFVIPIYVTTFFETANSWATASTFKFMDLFKYSSYGVGFKAQLPILGPVAIYFGYPLNKDFKNNSPTFHFSN